MHKVRSDSKYASLPPELQEEVDSMLYERQSYKSVQTMLADHGVQWSVKGICKYYLTHARPKKWAANAGYAQIINRQKTEDVTEATHKVVAEYVLDRLNRPNVTDKEISTLYGLVLKAVQINHDERKIKLLEAKAAKTDEIEQTMSDGKLTDEQRIRRINQIFGRPV